QSINGCDSTVVITLTVLPVYNHIVEVAICDGETYIFGTQNLTDSGEYTEIFQSINGCDSTVVLTLTVHPVYNHTDEAAICDVDTFVFGTQNLTASGEYTEIFQSINGCDSTVVLTLTVHPVYNHTDEAAICDGEDYIFGTQILNTTGEYTEIFQSINGCDSTVVLTLTVHPVYNHTDEVAICDGDTYEFGAQSLTTSGEYTEIFQSIDGCDSTVVLTLTVNVCLEICVNLKFNFGWNIFSSLNYPNPADMKTIFQPIIDRSSLVKIQDEMGSSLEDWGIFGGWQNNIGDIAPTEGYKIKVAFDDSLEICGLRVEFPFAIPLKEGWNIMGYPQTLAFDGMDIIQQLIDRATLLKVQDENGNAIEDWGIFGGWQNNIGDFVSGEGYKIKVNANDTLWIYESYPKSRAIIPELVATTHFKKVFDGNGVDHMNINLVGLQQNFAQAGDEIALFDGDICVGAITLLPHHLSLGGVSIPASASESGEMAGFTDGNEFSLILWNARQNQEYKLEPKIEEGPVRFKKHETTVLNLEKYATVRLNGLEISGLNNVKCYPNPFRDEVTVEINLLADSEVAVEVLNQLGQRVTYILTQKLLQEGKYQFIWDGRNDSNQKVSPGVYYLKINLNGTYLHEKIVLSK
ncbi:MAG: T9SS type A sorting domain-containing protein, partial [Prolixibacteraceae bacterium]|nr:T9SS type A sorting domain-containing protein [Prolixibacteraceae bacterium]